MLVARYTSTRRMTGNSVLILISALLALPSASSVRADVFASGNQVVGLNAGTYDVPVEAVDHSTLNVTDGIFNGSPTVFQDAMRSRDSSTINIHGGQFKNSVRSQGLSTMNIYGGNFSPLVDGQADSTLNIYGGIFGTIAGFPTSMQANGANVNVFGGDFLAPVHCNGGTLSIFGGDFNGAFQSNGFGRLNILGGHLNGDIATSSVARIYVYGQSFNLGFGDISGEGHLTGILLDGSPIDVSFTGTVVTVPEPSAHAVVCLLASMSLLWRKTR